MQGKPLNAWKATRNRVLKNPWLCELVATLGCGIEPDFQRGACRFTRIVLMFDPDADGIHAQALMGWFFLKWTPILIDEGSVWTVRPPLGEWDCGNGRSALYRTEQEAKHVAASLAAQGLTTISKKPYRGLASLDESTLARECVDPRTRNAQVLKRDQIEASLRIFGVIK